MLRGEWKVQRANGQRATFQADTEREATLLARESWPGEAFAIELVSRSCPQCGAAFGPEVKACPSCKAKAKQNGRKPSRSRAGRPGSTATRSFAQKLM